MLSQDGGYVLLAVLFLVAMILITLSAAVPKMAADIERDREVELIHRGQQYVRAIKLYYKRFGAYPPTMDALEKSNEIRFLRKRYKDPMTGKDDWHLIHYGENKTPSYGFFGQPISGAGGATLVGVGPGSGNIMGPGGAGNQPGGPLFGGSQLGGTPAGTANGTTGSDPNAGNNGASATGGTGATSTDGSSTSGTGAGTSGAGAGTGGTGSGDSSSGSTPGSTGSPSSGFGSSSPLTVGGLGIIGVESTSPKPTILIWKKKTHFNEWEFWYDPAADRMVMMNNLGQQGASTPSGQNGSSGFGSNPTTTTTPTTPTTPQPTTPQPTQPQQ